MLCASIIIAHACTAPSHSFPHMCGTLACRQYAIQLALCCFFPAVSQLLCGSPQALHARAGALPLPIGSPDIGLHMPLLHLRSERQSIVKPDHIWIESMKHLTHCLDMQTGQQLAGTLTCVERPAALRRTTACRRISPSSWFFTSTARSLPLPVQGQPCQHPCPEQTQPLHFANGKGRLTVLGVEVGVMPRPQLLFNPELWILLLEGGQEDVYEVPVGKQHITEVRVGATVQRRLLVSPGIGVKY